MLGDSGVPAGSCMTLGALYDEAEECCSSTAVAACLVSYVMSDLFLGLTMDSAEDWLLARQKLMS